MGTHVPLVALWKCKTPAGTVSQDLIDFTDFYTTFAQAAGTELDATDPIDGRSFLPQLQGQPGKPREWVLCHYQPYWNKKSAQWVASEGAEVTAIGEGVFKLSLPAGGEVLFWPKGEPKPDLSVNPIETYSQPHRFGLKK